MTVYMVTWAPLVPSKDMSVAGWGAGYGWSWHNRRPGCGAPKYGQGCSQHWNPSCQGVGHSLSSKLVTQSSRHALRMGTVRHFCLLGAATEQ